VQPTCSADVDEPTLVGAEPHGPSGGGRLAPRRRSTRLHPWARPGRGASGSLDALTRRHRARSARTSSLAHVPDDEHAAGGLERRATIPPNRSPHPNRRGHAAQTERTSRPSAQRAQLRNSRGSDDSPARGECATRTSVRDGRSTTQSREPSFPSQGRRAGKSSRHAPRAEARGRGLPTGDSSRLIEASSPSVSRRRRPRQPQPEPIGLRGGGADARDSASNPTCDVCRI